MDFMEQRRRMLMSILDRKTYIFKEGEGLVWGYPFTFWSEYCYCSSEYINVEGDSRGPSDDDNDYSYGIMLGGSPIENEVETSGWASSENGYDITRFKTLYIEFEVTSPGSYFGDYNHGYVGYRGNHHRISSYRLSNSDNSFNEQTLEEAYEDGAKIAVSPQSRNIVSFDITDKVDCQIVLLSPLSRDILPHNHMKVYNIWLEGNISTKIDREATYIYKQGDTEWKNVSEVSYSTEEPSVEFGENYVIIDAEGSAGYRYDILDLKVDFTNYKNLVITCSTSYATSGIGYASVDDKETFIVEEKLSGDGNLETFTFDISTLTGDYYIKLKPPGTTDSCLFITEIKLVP